MAEAVNATGSTSGYGVGMWSSPALVDTAGKDQFFPWIKTERTTNTVNITYYTAEADYYSHKLQVKLAQIAPGGTVPELPAGTTIVAPSQDDPAADPFLGDDFFGDYIGVVGVAGTVNGTAVHRAYLGFTYNVYYGFYGGTPKIGHGEQNNHVARFDY